MVHGTWYIVHGPAQHPAAGTVKALSDPWYMVHGTWYMVPGTWYMVHGTWYMV